MSGELTSKFKQIFKKSEKNILIFFILNPYVCDIIYLSPNISMDRVFPSEGNDKSSILFSGATL